MRYINLILILLTLSICISCKKKDVPPVDPIDQLPKATTYGANTFGCLVNGKAFLPKSGTWDSGGYVEPFICSVDFDNFGNVEYFVVAGFNNKDQPGPSVIINAKRLEIVEGETYPLTTYWVDGKASGRYELYYESGPDIEYYTNEIYTGELTITRYDYWKKIISGTFWFDAVNSKGELAEVREGRFDMKF